MTVFISHSARDEAIYSTLCLAFDAAAVPRWDVNTMTLGDSLSDQLRQAINDCHHCVFVATRQSIESQWCLAELGAFWGAGKTVILFLVDPDIDETALPPQFRGSLVARNANRLITEIRDSVGNIDSTTAQHQDNIARRIMSRADLYLECANLISDSQTIRDTSWGRRPRALSGQEKTANTTYRDAISDAIRAEKDYYELFGYSEERLPRIKAASIIAKPNPRYQVRVLDIDLSSLSMIDMMIGDALRVIMSHVDAEHPEKGRQFLYLESEPLAEVFIQHYQECWRTAKEVPEFPELNEPEGDAVS